MPGCPSRLSLRLAPGVSISGIVQDEEGNAIAGAKIEFTMPVTWPQLQSHVFTATEITTDAEGHWKWPDAPSDRAQANMYVSHPDHLPVSFRLGALRLQSTTLKRGMQVAGQVTDQQGKPIAGAAAGWVSIALVPTIPPRRPTPTAASRSRIASRENRSSPCRSTGTAPQFQELTVKDKNEDLSFQLEPGMLLRVTHRRPRGQPSHQCHVLPRYMAWFPLNRTPTENQPRRAGRMAAVPRGRHAVRRIRPGIYRPRAACRSRPPARTSRRSR